MVIEQSRTIQASTAQTWAALNDPLILQQCMPGCEEFATTAPANFLVAMKVTLGPVRARFRTTLIVHEHHDTGLHQLVFDAQGGIAGNSRGEATIQLCDHEGGTLLRYHVKAVIGGKIAQYGTRLIDAFANKMADEFFARFGAALEQRLLASHL